jgi:hypothetical protein
MKFASRFLVLAIVIGSISGCASIVTGTDQTLTFNSEPDGAKVTVAGRVIGKTPLSVQIKKGKNQSLTFEKEGYKTYTTQLSMSMNSWFWGNIVIGGLLGSTTDGMSGAINEFSPDQYFVTLVPDNGHGLSSSKARKLKEIVIAFGGDIRRDLTSGGGESSDAVISLLETEAGDKETTLLVLKKLASQSANDLEFAESIIDFYGLN